MTRSLEVALDRAVDQARAAWPALELDPALFRDYLRARLPEANAGALAALERLHAADLYLACACSRGDPQALAAFERDVFTRVRAHLARRYGAADLVDDAAQQLRQLLFVAEPGAAPRITSYSGRGPLGGWLRVAAARLVLRQTRRINAAAGAPVDSARIPLRAPDADPELGLLRAHYRREFAAAFEATLASLSSRERTVLRLHYLEGTPMEAIAELYKVHRLTVSRWLARVRKHLFEETRHRLAVHLPSSTDWNSVMALVGSRLEVSIRRHLATRSGRADGRSGPRQPR